MGNIGRFVNKLNTAAFRSVAEWQGKTGLRRYRVTFLLVLLLIGWYELQILTALFFDFGISEIRHWFKLSVKGGANPGWLVAGISHQFPPGYDHLGYNVLLLAVFGSLAERHLTTRQYVLFFLGAGFMSLFLDSLYWAFQGTNAVVMGSSGAVFGLTGFYCYHSVRHHEKLLTLSPADPGRRRHLRITRTILVIVLPISVVLLLTAELLGFKSSGDSATVAHLAGFILGFTLDYAISTSNGHPTICTVEK